MKKIKQEDYRNLHIQSKEYILTELKAMYDTLTISKKELANVLNISEKTISNKMSSGDMKINHIKLGNCKQATVRFPIIAIAEFLTNELLETEPFEEYKYHYIEPNNKLDNKYSTQIVLEKKHSSKTKRNKLWMKQN